MKNIGHYRKCTRKLLMAYLSLVTIIMLFVIKNISQLIRTCKAGLLLLLTAASMQWSSCSYHYFYPQRLNIYAFDSVHETKTITRPLMNFVGAQLGVSHSVTNHFLVAATGQAQSTVVRVPKSNQPYRAAAFAYAFNAALGYYHTYPTSNGFEVVPQLSYERNQLFFRYPSLTEPSPAEESFHMRIQYIVPALQFSYYHVPEKKTNYYASFRFSYVLADGLRNGLVLGGDVPHDNFYAMDVLLEPGFHFILGRFPNIRVETAAFISLGNPPVKNYHPLVLLNIRIKPAALGINLKKKIK